MRQPTTAHRIEQLMRELGAAVTSEGRVYFTGKLLELFAAVEQALIRYPALDAAKLGSRVSAIAANGAWL